MKRALHSAWPRVSVRHMAAIVIEVLDRVRNKLEEDT